MAQLNIALNQEEIQALLLDGQCQVVVGFLQLKIGSTAASGYQG